MRQRNNWLKITAIAVIVTLAPVQAAWARGRRGGNTDGDLAMAAVGGAAQAALPAYGGTPACIGMAAGNITSAGMTAGEAHPDTTRWASAGVGGLAGGMAAGGGFATTAGSMTGAVVGAEVAHQVDPDGGIWGTLAGAAAGSFASGFTTGMLSGSGSANTSETTSQSTETTRQSTAGAQGSGNTITSQSQVYTTSDLATLANNWLAQDTNSTNVVSGSMATSGQAFNVGQLATMANAWLGQPIDFSSSSPRAVSAASQVNVPAPGTFSYALNQGINRVYNNIVDTAVSSAVSATIEHYLEKNVSERSPVRNDIRRIGSLVGGQFGNIAAGRPAIWDPEYEMRDALKTRVLGEDGTYKLKVVEYDIQPGDPKAAEFETYMRGQTALGRRFKGRNGEITEHYSDKELALGKPLYGGGFGDGAGAPPPPADSDYLFRHLQDIGLQQPQLSPTPLSPDIWQQNE